MSGAVRDEGSATARRTTDADRGRAIDDRAALLDADGTRAEALEARLAELRHRRAVYADPDLCDEVRDLVVVCSSSRSGSTLLGEILRASPQLLTTSAEINPHLVMPALDRGRGPDPDLLADPTPVCGGGKGRSIARNELSLDLGDAYRVDTSSPDALAVFAEQVAWRLTMQWPRTDVDPEVVGAHVRDLGAPTAGHREWFVRLLRRLRRRHPELDPAHYDLGPRAESSGPNGATVPLPAEPIVEMAPFVVPRPWRHATREEARSRTVVLITPRNAFRVPLLASLFPRARVRIVHLTRNPAASINGLRDGWLHPGFVACRIPEGLRIRGYSDVHPRRGDLWSFDLPRSWRNVTDATLEQVCALQWRAAHEATIESAEGLGLERHVVRFEDLTADPRRRAGALSALSDFLGTPAGPLAVTRELPVVMATRPPRPRRWRCNEAVLGEVLCDPAVLRTSTRLGYGVDAAGWD